MTLLIALGLVVVYSSAPQVFRASGSLVMLPPQQPTVGPGVTLPPGEQNPYIRVGDSSVVLDIISRRMRSPGVDAKMRERGLQGSLIVGASLIFYRGPILDISADAPTGAAAINDVRVAFEEVKRQLAQLQGEQNTSPAFSIVATEVVEPDLATHVLTGTLRRLVAAGLAGGLAILLSAVVAEGLSIRRRQRLERRRQKKHQRLPTLQEAASGEDIGFPQEEGVLDQNVPLEERLSTRPVPSAVAMPQRSGTQMEEERPNSPADTVADPQEEESLNRPLSEVNSALQSPSPAGRPAPQRGQRVKARATQPPGREETGNRSERGLGS